MRTQDHFYYSKASKLYVPSVTKILDIIAKGEFFNAWLKKQGANADKLLTEAGDFGTNVHNMLEAIGRGITINLDCLKPKERRCVEAFIAWKDAKVARFIETEHEVCTPTYGGTMDALVELKDGRVALLDYKTSKYIYDTYDLQVASYVKAYELNTGKKVDTGFILRFEKQDDNKIDMEEKEVLNISESFELFECARRLWVWKHKDKLDKANSLTKKEN